MRCQTGRKLQCHLSREKGINTGRRGQEHHSDTGRWPSQKLQRRKPCRMLLLKAGATSSKQIDEEAETGRCLVVTVLRREGDFLGSTTKAGKISQPGPGHTAAWLTTS